MHRRLKFWLVDFRIFGTEMTFKIFCTILTRRRLAKKTSSLLRKSRLFSMEKYYLLVAYTDKYNNN